MADENNEEEGANKPTCSGVGVLAVDGLVEGALDALGSSANDATDPELAGRAAFGVALRGVVFCLLSAFRFFSAPLSGLGGSAPPRLRLATDAGDCRNCANVWSTGCVKSTEKSPCSARLRRKKHTTKKL